MTIDGGPDVERPLLAVKMAGFPSVGATVLESLVGVSVVLYRLP
jgi:hypothetical protein